MKIIDCDDHVIEQLPNIMNLVYEIFGEKDIAIFAVLDGNDLGFIARVGEDCLFINNKGDYTLFKLNENEDLLAITTEQFVVYYGDVLCFVVGDKEYSVSINRNDELDEDGYDGLVEFRQYDKSKDIMCIINYQHMYRMRDGKVPIYGFHTKRLSQVYIDEEYSKKKLKSCGFLPKTSKYYGSFSFNEGEIGYDIIAIKDYGLVSFLKRGAYDLIRESTIKSFSRCYTIDFSGNYRDIWPFGRIYTEDEIKEQIESYGFLSEIPTQMLEVYNDQSKDVELIKQLVLLMKEIKPLLSKPENSRKKLLLTFSNDD